MTGYHLFIKEEMLHPTPESSWSSSANPFPQILIEESNFPLTVVLKIFELYFLMLHKYELQLICSPYQSICYSPDQSTNLLRLDTENPIKQMSKKHYVCSYSSVRNYKMLRTAFQNQHLVIK